MISRGKPVEQMSTFRPSAVGSLTISRKLSFVVPATENIRPVKRSNVCYGTRNLLHCMRQMLKHRFDLRMSSLLPSLALCVLQGSVGHTLFSSGFWKASKEGDLCNACLEKARNVFHSLDEGSSDLSIEAKSVPPIRRPTEIGNSSV